MSRNQISNNVEIIEVRNHLASARISLFGGQVLSFIPERDARERLYVSRTALFDGSKPIRGGIPVCWPWFASHPNDLDCPFHGFVRNRQWTLVESEQTDNSTVLVLKPTDTASECFTGKGELNLKITMTGSLCLELISKNIGNFPFQLTCAMHSYFAVSDIRQTTLEGLQGIYSDKVHDFAHFETPEHYAFTAETDRIHLIPSPEVIIREPGEETRVKSSGHDSLVVWNPWTACHENFPDMEADDYLRMVCVETALTSGITLAPGQVHILRQEIY